MRRVLRISPPVAATLASQRSEYVIQHVRRKLCTKECWAQRDQDSVHDH